MLTYIIKWKSHSKMRIIWLIWHNSLESSWKYCDNQFCLTEFMWEEHSLFFCEIHKIISNALLKYEIHSMCSFLFPMNNCCHLMTANFDTKHLLKKLRSLFRKLYSTCFVFAATDCFDQYTWCHLVPQHKVCDHEFYGTHCCLSCKGHRWCLIWCSTTTIQFLLW